MPIIYEMKHSEEVEAVLEDMRIKLSESFGVTVKGNRVTLRWYLKGNKDHFCDIHMIIDNVYTPTESIEAKKRHERIKQLVKKYPEMAGEMYYAETGEHMQ
jgi:hypothetical protein